MKYPKNEIKESYFNAILKRPPKNLILEKIDRRNFEDVSSGNAIFRIGVILIVSIKIKSIKIQRNFEDVSSKSAISENSIKIMKNEPNLKIGRLSDESAQFSYFHNVKNS